MHVLYSKGKYCRYNGRVYRVGQTFPASDGCNSCTCTYSFGIICTTRPCRPCTYNMHIKCGENASSYHHIDITHACHRCKILRNVNNLSPYWHNERMHCMQNLEKSHVYVTYWHLCNMSYTYSVLSYKHRINIMYIKHFYKTKKEGYMYVHVFSSHWCHLDIMYKCHACKMKGNDNFFLIASTLCICMLCMWKIVGNVQIFLSYWHQLRMIWMLNGGGVLTKFYRRTFYINNVVFGIRRVSTLTNSLGFVFN